MREMNTRIGEIKKKVKPRKRQCDLYSRGCSLLSPKRKNLIGTKHDYSYHR